ncbi:hypothetical protein [Flagellimonas marinaquae]
MNTKLIISRLKVLRGFSCAKTAPLYAMQKIVTRKSKIIFRTISKPPMSRTMAAAEPKQLCPIMAMAA